MAAEPERAPIPLEEISSGASALAGEADLAGMASRLRTILQLWAAPSLVVGVEKDAGAEGGWRVIPELSSGPLPAGFERSIAKLVEDSPSGSLTRPTLIRPVEEMAGVKVRDICIVPWSRGASSGLLVLRGVPRPYPPNLGDAVALVSQPLWPVVARASQGGPPAERIRRLEEAAAEAHRLAERLRAEVRDEQERLGKETERPPSGEATPAREAEVEEARRQVSALQETGQALEKSRAEAESERDRARAEATELRGRVVTLEKDAQAQRASAADERKTLAELEEKRQLLATLQAKLEAVEKGGAEAAAERDRARAEATELRGRVVTLEKDAHAEKARETDKALAELDEKRTLLTTLQARMEALEKARAEAASQRDRAEGEAAELRDRVDALEKKAGAETTSAAEARRQAAALQEKVDGLDKGRAALEAERDRAKTEANQLWGSVESLQKQLQADKERFEAEKASLEQARWSLEKALAAEAAALRSAAETERDQARAAAAAAADKAAQAEERARLLGERWEKTVGSFREAIQALRRTPFVPPTLRVSLSTAEGFLGPEDQPAHPRAGAKPTRILLLDRDTSSLDRLAGELEAAGIEALIAHYPEEVGFFLKTPDSRGLAAVVCDVMAFRGDQDLLGLFKSWRQDLPNLALLLSFKADNPTEAEKAQRIPTVLAAGYLPRPVQRDVLLEAVATISKRQAGR